MLRMIMMMTMMMMQMIMMAMVMIGMMMNTNKMGLSTISNAVFHSLSSILICLPFPALASD